MEYGDYDPSGRLGRFFVFHETSLAERELLIENRHKNKHDQKC